MFDAKVVAVLIASPSTLSDERDAVQRSLDEWNSTKAQYNGQVYMPLRWEYGDFTGFNVGGPQVILNDELASRADIVVAMLWYGLGSRTPRDMSGTLEEINGAVARGLPVHVLFKTTDIPVDTNPAELQHLQDYKASLRSRAMYAEFKNLTELQRRVDWILDRDARQLSHLIGTHSSKVADSVRGPDDYVETATPVPVDVVWVNAGRVGTLTVTNRSKGALVNISIRVQPLGSGMSPSPTEQDRRIPLSSEESWRVLCHVPKSLAPKFEVDFSCEGAGTRIQHKFQFASDLSSAS